MALIDVYYKLGSLEAQLAGTRWIYNVTSAVGPGAPNLGEDVALVQTLLSAAADGVDGMKEVAVDGKFGPKTQDQILIFQKYCKAKGAPIVIDGRIDRARGAAGSISHARYTIQYLNDAVYFEHPEYFPDIDSMSTVLPPVLWQIKARGIPTTSV